MSLWEYKHFTSGPHGFATPALLESYLNQLGKDEWEIISYQTLPTNPLAFTGIARRTTLRDWTLESAAAAAAKVEADKLRAEFAAKFQGQGASAVEPVSEKPTTLAIEAAAGEDGLRKLRDTERDGDPDAADEEESGDWDSWDNYDDDLPTLFEAIKPHLRKNQRGPGQSVGIGFLAKRWEQTEGDLIGALKECGFIVPESEDTPPEYLEFEGDLYWLNLNNRHELFLNTREKPRPVFRAVPAKKLDPADPVNAVLAEEVAAEQAEKAKREAERLAREAEHAARRAEREAQRLAAEEARRQADEARRLAAAQRAAAGATAAEAVVAPVQPAEAAEAAGAVAPAAAAAPEASEPRVAGEAALPTGEALLAAIRPQMRRNRRGPGYSGSMTYLARALRCSEPELVAALVALGLHVPATAAETPVFSEIGEHVYWLNKDNRGGVWINGDECPPGGLAAAIAEAKGLPVESAAAPAPVSAPAPASTVSVAVSESASEPASEPTLPSSPVVSSPVAEPAESPAPAEAAVESPRAPTGADAGPASPLAAVRLLLKPNKRGSGVSGEVGYLARALDKDLQVFLSVLTGLGLALPETEEHKPSFVEHEDEIFWLNKNAKDGSVWINAKTSRAAAKKTAAAPKARTKRAPKA